MPYLSQDALQAIGFRRLGQGVKVSDKAAIYNPESISLGNFCRIDDFCVISGKVELGRNVHIAPQCLIAGGEPGVLMRDFSGLAYGVKVFAQSDDYSGQTLTNPTIPSEYKKEYKSTVTIGKHVIVGAGAIIFPGITIEEGCAIGALALLTKSTQAWSIYAGNPARRIKKRSQDLLTLEKKFIADEAGGNTDL